MSFASGSQLAQARPAGTSAVALYTATMRTEATLLVIANTTGTAAAYSVYHDDDGTTYDATTALAEAVSLAANATVYLLASPAPGCGLVVRSGGTLAIKTGTGSALTFTLYGVTEARRAG